MSAEKGKRAAYTLECKLEAVNAFVALTGLHVLVCVYFAYI